MYAVNVKKNLPYCATTETHCHTDVIIRVASDVTKYQLTKFAMRHVLIRQDVCYVSKVIS